MAENLAPHVVASLGRQLRQLATSAPEGVRFVPCETLNEIFADIDGPEKTPYEGGTFRVKLVLTKEYPAAPPKGYFLTKIFHPNVAAGGDICVNTLKKDWTPDTSLSHVLAVIRCLLIVPFPESSLNDDAGKLFMESYDEYFRRAKLMTSIHAMAGARGGAGASSEAAAPVTAVGGSGASSDAAESASSSAAASSEAASVVSALGSKVSNASETAASATAAPAKTAVAATAKPAADSAAAAAKKKTMKRL